MNQIQTFLYTICLVVIRTSDSVGYEVINNEIIERIDLDNGRDLQLLSSTGSLKETPKINHHVENIPPSGDDFNSVHNSHESSSVSNHQPSIIYAAVQAMPHTIESRHGHVDADESPIIQHETTEVSPDNTKKPHSKLDPSEDKSKNAKAKLYSHLKQAMPKLFSMLNVEIQNKRDASTGEVETTLRTVNIQPYATIIDDDTDLKAEQTEDPYVVYDKQDYLKPKHVKKTVKTQKIGDEKKSVYPKEEIKIVPSALKEKDDMETDNTIWIGYGLGLPNYKYPYNSNYPSPSLYGNYYSYGRPYSGWTRGYTGSQYYGGYLDRSSLDTGYSGGSYNNYGTGYGPYGGYL